MGATNWGALANGGVASGTNAMGSGVGTDFDVTWLNNYAGSGARYDGTFGHYYLTTVAGDAGAIITLAGSKPINRVILWFGYGGGASETTDPGDATGILSPGGPTNFTIETWNGATWDVQATITGNTLAKRTIEFSPVPTTKVRCVVTTVNANTFYVIYEMEVWEYTFDVSFAGAGAFAAFAPSTAIGAVVFHGAGAAAVVPRGPLIAGWQGSGLLTAVGLATTRGAAAFAGVGSFTNPPLSGATNVLQTVANCKAYSYWADSSPPSDFTLTNTNLDPSTFGGTPVWRAALTDNNPAVGYTTLISGTLLDTDTVHVFIPPTGVGGHPLSDTLVIYSSDVVDRSFGFGDPEHHGLVGRSQTVDESGAHLPYVGQIIAIYFHGSDVPAGISYDPANAKQITFIQNNRQTRLEVRLTAPAHVAAVQIRGARLLNAAGGFTDSNIVREFALDVGTVIREIQLLSTRTVHTAMESSTANATSTALRVTQQAYESTADATASAIGKRGAIEVSTAHATANDASRAQVVETLVSSAVASDVAKGVGTAVLESTAVATNALALLHHATLVETAQAANVLSTKLTHAEVSSAAGAAETTAGRSIGQTEISTAEATAIVIGRRKVTATEVSSAAGGDSNAAHAHVIVSLQSEAQALATLLTHAQMRVTAVSTAHATDTLRLPGLPTSIFWTNTQNLAAALWEGLPFNSMVQVAGVAYAADEVGVRQLLPKANDLTTVIESEVAWDLLDYGSSKMKRLRSVYIHGTADGPFRFRVISEQGGFDYQTHLATALIATQHRAPLGRGWNSVNYRFGLLQDHYFSLSGLIVEMGDTTRRI